MSRKNFIQYQKHPNYKNCQIHIENMKLIINDINKIQAKLEKKQSHKPNEQIKIELKTLSQIQKKAKNDIEYLSKISFSKYKGLKEINTAINKYKHEVQSIKKTHAKDIKKHFDKIHSILPIKDIISEITLHNSDDDSDLYSVEHEYMFITEYIYM